MTAKFRIEHDSMGQVEVPAAAMYGAQTQRAVDNFPVSGWPLPPPFIHALGLIKAAAAQANEALGLLDPDRARAIRKAALKVAAGSHDAQFPVDVFQTGSGTSTHMNANEVIAHLASRSGLAVHPNDHVNAGQSSNDVIPTAILVSASLQLDGVLRPALKHLRKVIERKAASLHEVVKTGRTHLMDAMPLTFGQELGAWAAQLKQADQRLGESLRRCRRLPQGGSAVGTGINVDARFPKAFARQLSKLSGLRFSPADNLFAGIAGQDSALDLSAQLKGLAVVVMKIANDLRWMNSGPLAGLGEITLPALQPGSSIMPGKVNPVIPESAAMVAAQVIGFDTAITVAAQSGQFQLNVMLPMIAYNLLQSIKLLANSCRLLADKAIAGFQVQRAQVEAALARNPVLVTALNPVIGYELGAAIAKQAYREGRPILEVAVERSGLARETLQQLLDPLRLTHGGLPESAAPATD